MRPTPAKTWNVQLRDVFLRHPALLLLLGRLRAGGIAARLGSLDLLHHLRPGTFEFVIRQFALFVHLAKVSERESLPMHIFVRVHPLARPRHADE